MTGRPRQRRGPRGNLAERLRAARAALAMTQEDAAKAIGVHRTSIARWETGAERPIGPALRYVEEWCDRATGKGGNDGA